MVETGNGKAKCIVMWPLNIDYMSYNSGVTLHALRIMLAPFTRHGDIEAILKTKNGMIIDEIIPTCPIKDPRNPYPSEAAIILPDEMALHHLQQELKDTSMFPMSCHP